MADKIIKIIFCANEQKETTHILSASPAGDIDATCESCGRFIRFPAGIDKETLDALIAQHKIANEGQVTQESIDKNLSELADTTAGGIQSDEQPIPTP